VNLAAIAKEGSQLMDPVVETYVLHVRTARQRSKRERHGQPRREIDAYQARPAPAPAASSTPHHAAQVEHRESTLPPPRFGEPVANDSRVRERIILRDSFCTPDAGDRANLITRAPNIS
jgi:hypothetical protein